MADAAALLDILSFPRFALSACRAARATAPFFMTHYLPRRISHHFYFTSREASIAASKPAHSFQPMHGVASTKMLACSRLSSIKAGAYGALHLADDRLRRMSAAPLPY